MSYGVSILTYDFKIKFLKLCSSEALANTGIATSSRMLINNADPGNIIHGTVRRKGIDERGEGDSGY